MPIYSYTCPCCGALREVIQGMNEMHALTCDECDMDMDRIWHIPALSGDLPQTKGCFNEFYDAVTGKVITGTGQWEDAKKATGRIQFEPDPDHEAARKEAQYIEQHSPPGDKDARVAAHKRMKAVHDRKAEARAEANRRKHVEKAIKELSSVDIT